MLQSTQHSGLQSQNQSVACLKCQTRFHLYVQALGEVLDFLDVEDEHANRKRRLECAAGLADHPLVHRPPANYTIRHAFAGFPEHVCTLIRTIEQHEQVCMGRCGCISDSVRM